ncbi:transposase IS4 family protein [Hydrogenobacter thermophilus TK-6]|nr:transposase IS4 family protein [Hydrogenobacter thermophilus TK-6]
MKTEALIGIVRGKSVAVGVKAGVAYSDENRLLLEILKDFPFRSSYFVGDAYYGKSVEVLKRVKKLGMKAVVPVRDTMRRKVRDEYRLWVKGNYERMRKVYKKYRYRVEQFFGTIKNLFGDRDRVCDFHIASLYVLGRFVLYNLMVLAELLLLSLKLLRVMVFFRHWNTSAWGIFKHSPQALDNLTT